MKPKRASRITYASITSPHRAVASRRQAFAHPPTHPLVGVREVSLCHRRVRPQRARRHQRVNRAGRLHRVQQQPRGVQVVAHPARRHSTLRVSLCRAPATDRVMPDSILVLSECSSMECHNRLYHQCRLPALRRRAPRARRLVPLSGPGPAVLGEEVTVARRIDYYDDPSAPPSEQPGPVGQRGRGQRRG